MAAASSARPFEASHPSARHASAQRPPPPRQWRAAARRGAGRRRAGRVRCRQAGQARWGRVGQARRGQFGKVRRHARAALGAKGAARQLVRRVLSRQRRGGFASRRARCWTRSQRHEAMGTPKTGRRPEAAVAREMIPHAWSLARKTCGAPSAPAPALAWRAPRPPPPPAPSPPALQARRRAPWSAAAHSGCRRAAVGHFGSPFHFEPKIRFWEGRDGKSMRGSRQTASRACLQNPLLGQV